MMIYNNNMKTESIAILIPCFNEEKTISKVIRDFKKQIPCAKIYVYDNNSTDNTASIAKESGAIVVSERNQGKGNVVRSMFRDIDADIYLMVDGDDTYPADESYKIIDMIQNGYDMVIGDRLSSTYYTENKRPFHNFGNSLVKTLINIIFKSNIKDVMTGYRGFSKKFVKTIAVMSPGFQIETELTITALEYKYNIGSVEIQYRDRPEGSSSKLNTFKDGTRVMLTLFDLFKDYKPFLFFGIIAIIFGILGLLVGVPVILEFVKNNYVYKVPSAILASSLIVVSLLFMVLGTLLDHQTNIDKKNHELYVKEWLDRK